MFDFVRNPAIAWMSSTREESFYRWLLPLAVPHALHLSSLRPASADASFRRYFRIDAAQSHLGGSFILMDAPPDKENSEPFVTIAQVCGEAGLLVPQVLDWDRVNGFMLLTDLGAQTMLDVLDQGEVYAHTNSTVSANLPQYEQALDALIAWQLASQPNALPPYSEALLMRELQLFPDWYIAQHRQKILTSAQQAALQTTFNRIIQHNVQAPNVYVHRDFMPRNLMMPYPHWLGSASAAQQWGVLDFQDAVYGPITYDIASLMRDAFVSWDEDFVIDVTIRYWQRAKQVGLLKGHEWESDFGEFYKAVEWMGLQRHLKILGIFARLTLRDGKPKYLADTPRFMTYVRATCARYHELRPLLRLVDEIEA